MRWKESSSAHSTGSTTITSTTMTVGETSAMPARESRRARVARARRVVSGRGLELGGHGASSRPDWISSTVACTSLAACGRVLAADHVGDRARDRLLTAQRADQRALALGEAPALEVLDAVGRARRSSPRRRTRLSGALLSTPLSSPAHAVWNFSGSELSPARTGYLPCGESPSQRT